MVKKSFFKKRNKRQKSTPVHVGEPIFALLAAMGGNRERARMSQLWESWAEVLGEDLAALATPMGYKGDLLLLGAEDAMDIQELSLQTEDILCRVNGFLNKEYFTRVKINLKNS